MANGNALLRGRAAILKPQISLLTALTAYLSVYLIQLRAINSLTFSCSIQTERDRVRPFAHLATHCVFDKLSVLREEMLKPLLFICAFASLSLLFRFQRELFSFSFSPSAPSSSQQGSKLGHTLSPNSKEAIHNSTLGFADIYLINMPGRTDKLDAFRLLASVTNLSYTVVPGVDGSKIQHIAWPGFYKEGRESNIGSWRAHMNAVASILDNRLSSALIIEDDADWDVNLKTQLTRFALGSRYILNAPISSESLFPYGDGWDMLWLGHCAQDPPSQPFARFFIANETTIPPAGRRWSLWNPEETLTYDLSHNHTTRVVYRPTGGVCSYAYALSYTGAQKMLFHLSYSHFDGPFDIGLRDLCARGTKTEIDFSCVGIYPGLIHGTFGEADIGHEPGRPRKEREKEKGTPSAPNLVFSARANLWNMIDRKELVGRWQGEEEIGDMEMWFEDGRGG